jgi:hypothetical protein
MRVALVDENILISRALLALEARNRRQACTIRGSGLRRTALQTLLPIFRRRKKMYVST